MHPYSQSSSKMVTGAEPRVMSTEGSVLSSCTKNVLLFSNIISFRMVTDSHWREMLVLKIRTAEMVLKSISAAEISTCMNTKYCASE